MPPIPSHRRNNNGNNNNNQQRIIVPQRCIQGGFDMKFETDPYNIELYGILTETQYTNIITNINDRLKKARYNKIIDTTLLITGPLMVPLALWGIRHNNQKKKRKRQLKKGIIEFHNDFPHLLMRWNKRPQSMLTIERRIVEHIEYHQHNNNNANPPVATAELITQETSSSQQELMTTTTTTSQPHPFV